jgi:para-aminobenzoate synthetase component 2
VRHTELPIHGVQFHPESILTEGGHRMLANWLTDCGWSRDDTLIRRLENEVRTAVRPYFPADPAATGRTSA